MSPTHTLLPLFLFFSLLISLSISTTISIHSKSNPYRYDSFIKTACGGATYPDLCRQTCLPHAAKIKADPQKLVIAALSATLTATTSSATTVSRLSKKGNLGPYEARALKDCIENMGDSIDDLKQSIFLLKDLKDHGSGNNRNQVKFKVSSVLTWMSAAITNEDTCMDGIGEKNKVGPLIRTQIRGCVLEVVKLTSNALSLCNHLDYS